MENHNAKMINKALGVDVFRSENVERLEINKFTKKQIKELHIDDLIDPNTKQGTDRLARFVKYILFGGFKNADI